MGWNGDNVKRRVAQVGVVVIVMAAGLAVSPAVAGASQPSSVNPSSVAAPLQTIKLKKSPRYSSDRSCELNRRDYQRYYNTTPCYWYKDGYYFFYQNK